MLVYVPSKHAYKKSNSLSPLSLSLSIMSYGHYHKLRFNETLNLRKTINYSAKQASPKKLLHIDI